MRSEATSRAQAEGIAHMTCAAAGRLLARLVYLNSAIVASILCYEKVLSSTLGSVTNRKIWRHRELFEETMLGRNTRNPSPEDRPLESFNACKQARILSSPDRIIDAAAVDVDQKS
ncbi:hypothetical protein JJC00_32375 [Bradyrhizobium diazoefficiens]|uniref:hypothetical protein n=1 Tax=Bradyrhizobium diazoefficiens TaxID=1355477 RepID=UPI00190AAFD4|nr:hypothetical protein [Bradyrhizobium diazoefficiens]QQO33181.1 hypothetical protein JJC00_32375 [Bradyrhizobium diazoefficiens]